MIPVSVKGVLVWNDAVVLLRNDRDEWELPGGRIDVGEQPDATLRRELKEELRLDATVGALVLAESFEVVPGRSVLVLAYRCSAARPRSLTHSEEHTGVLLAPLGTLDQLPLPAVYVRAVGAAVAPP